MTAYEQKTVEDFSITQFMLNEHKSNRSTELIALFATSTGFLINAGTTAINYFSTNPDRLSGFVPLTTGLSLFFGVAVISVCQEQRYLKKQIIELETENAYKFKVSEPSARPIKILPNKLVFSAGQPQPHP